MSADARPARSWARTLLVFGLASSALWPLLYALACAVSPPRTPDGHPVMPIGQVFLATAASPVLGAILAWWLGRRR